MDNDFIYVAFRLGAGAVLYSGCHQQDCHYITGQQVGATRADRLMKLFNKLEMTPGRFRVEWISAAEGDKYARVINEMQQVVDDMPHDKLIKEIERLKPEMEKRSRRMYEVPEIDKAVIYSDEMVKAITAKEVESGN